MFYAWKPLEWRWYERLAVDALADVLDPSIGSMLRLHATEVNRVIRLDEGREVDLYRTVGRLIKRQDWTGIPAFPWADVERVLGRCRLESQGVSCLATVTAVDGYLFQIVFDGDLGGLVEGSTKVEANAA